MERILILGVGNILFTDEGIGVRALEWLRERFDFPGHVTLLDGGTLGIGLMDALLQCDRVYVLDAVLGGDKPGTVYRLTDNDLRKSMSFRDSLHQTDLVDTLIYCDMLGHRPEGVVYGMEPYDYHAMAVGLSFAVIGVPVWGPALLIGLVCAAVTASGVKLGHILGSSNFLGSKISVLGGLVLIGIGVKILFEHGVC